MAKIYRHTSGVEGTFYKRYRPTGLNYYYIMVDTFDGRRFYAPEEEWRILSKYEKLKRNIVEEIHSWDGAESGWGDEASENVLHFLDKYLKGESNAKN